MITPGAEQVEAWRHIAQERTSAVMNALAGSGKSTVLLYGLNYLPPTARVTLSSFGKSIVEELALKVASGAYVQRPVYVHNLHSIGRRMIIEQLRPANREIDRRRSYRAVALAQERRFGRQLDNQLIFEYARMVDLCRSSLAHSIELIDQVLRGPAASLDALHMRPEVILDAISYLAEDVTSFDFVDMVWLPLVRGLWFEPNDFVGVDEAQDLDPAQIQFVLRMRAAEGRIFAVGDRNQALYRWRSAAASAMDDIEAATSAVSLPLTVTRRCDRAIVDYARRWVPSLMPREDAGPGLVEHIDWDEFGIGSHCPAVGDFVISRTNAALGPCFGRLRRRGLEVTQLGRDGAVRDAVRLIQRSKTSRVDELIGWLESYLAKKLSGLSPEQIHQAAAIEDQVGLALGYAQATDAFSTSALVVEIEAAAQERHDASVILGTTHALKGREAETVWMLNDTYEKSRDSEEERRNLCYVAVTRAKKRLVVVHGRPATSTKLRRP